MAVFWITESMAIGVLLYSIALIKLQNPSKISYFCASKSTTMKKILFSTILIINGIFAFA